MSHNMPHSLIGPEFVHHIGIAVRSIEEVKKFYTEILAAFLEDILEVPDQGVRVAFLRIGAQEQAVRLELLEPTRPDSPIAAFLEKRGPGIHHIAYAVGDVAKRLDALRHAGIKLIDQTPRAGAHGMPIAFLHPHSTAGVLTELCSPAKARP